MDDTTSTESTESTGAREEVWASALETVRASTVKAVNAATPGTVTCHYKARDVVFEVDGDVALRMHVVFRRGRADDLGDIIDLSSTLALNGWLTMSTKGLMGITWAPGVDAREAVGAPLLELLDALDGPDNGINHVKKLLAAAMEGEAKAPPSASTSFADITDEVEAQADADLDVGAVVDEMVDGPGVDDDAAADPG